MKRTLSNLFVLILAFCLAFPLSGCMRYINSNKMDEKMILESVKQLISVINSGNTNDFRELFISEKKEAVSNESLRNFFSAKPEIIKAYTETSGYECRYCRTERGREWIYHFVNCIFVTNNDMYKVRLDFIILNDQFFITKLHIITSETEAVENMNTYEKYHFDESSVFQYADYYNGQIHSDIVLCDGEMLIRNKNAAEITSYNPDLFIGKSRSEIEARFGQCVAEWNLHDVIHALYYLCPNNDEYIRLKLDENNAVSYVTKTDSIGTEYGMTELEFP